MLTVIDKYPDPVSRRRYMEQLYYESMERIYENDDMMSLSDESDMLMTLISMKDNITNNESLDGNSQSKYANTFTVNV